MYSFAIEYIKKFTTPDNIWHDETPLYTLDTRSIDITLGLVAEILACNNIELTHTNKHFQFGYILDELAGTIAVDEDSSWIYIVEIRIGAHSTALLANVERHVSNISGKVIRYFYRKDIKINPDEYKKLYELVYTEDDNTVVLYSYKRRTR